MVIIGLEIEKANRDEIQKICVLISDHNSDHSDNFLGISVILYAAPDD